ncbi:MAG: TolC family protein [Oligoflexia bacterium]|nr:TolC family protein [Oligoflexia bacterium]
MLNIHIGIMIFILHFLFLASECYSDNNRNAIDLKQAIKYLISNSPTLASLKLEVANSELAKKNAFAAFLPSLDLNATHGLQNRYTNNSLNPPSGKNNNTWTSSISLDLSETFYDNGVSVTNYKISELKRQKVELNYRKELERLTFEFCNEFLNYSYLKKILAIQNEQLVLIKKQNAIISKIYYQGLKSKKDFLRSKTDVSRLEIEITLTTNGIEKSKMEIFRLLSWTYSEDQQTNQINFIPIDEKDSTKLQPLQPPPIENYFEHKVGMLQQNITELETSQIDKKNWPEFSLTSGVSYSSNNYIGGSKSWSHSFADNDSTSWNLLFKIKYNILDWGVRAHDKEIANNKKIIEKKQFENEMLVLKTNMNKLLLDLHDKWINYKTNQELLDLEKDTYELIYNEYHNGKVSYLDLITALKSLTEAKTKFFSAFFDLRRGFLSYYFNKGTLYETISNETTPK